MEDDEGRIYIGTTAGVAYVDKDGELSAFQDERLLNERVLRLVMGKDGKVYGSTKSGAVFLIKSGQLQKIYTGEELQIDPISTIYTDPEQNGQVYIGTKTGKTFYGKFGEKKDKLKVLEADFLTGVKWITAACGRIFITSDSVISYLSV